MKSAAEIKINFLDAIINTVVESRRILAEDLQSNTITQEQFDMFDPAWEFMVRAFEQEKREVLSENTTRSCRHCGCTDWDCRQCVERTGHACSWVSADECSACVAVPPEDKEFPTPVLDGYGDAR